MTRHHPHKQTPPLTPLRRVWLLFALTGLGCCVGVLALLYGAAAYVKLPGLALFAAFCIACLGVATWMGRKGRAQAS